MEHLGSYLFQYLKKVFINIRIHVHQGVPENTTHLLNCVNAESLPSLEKKNEKAGLAHAMKSQIVIQLLMLNT